MPTLISEPVRIDAERGSAPINMAVKIEQPGRDDRAFRVDDLERPVGRDFTVERNDPAILERHIADAVDTGRRIDEAPALHQKIE